MNIMIRILTCMGCILFVILWSSCSRDNNKPAIINFTRADQQIKDSLWKEYYNYRYSDKEMTLKIMQECKVLEDKYDPQVSKVNYYSNLVHYFAEIDMLDSAKMYVDSQWNLLETGTLKAGNLKANVYATRGLYFAGKEQWDSAIAYNLQALDWLRLSPDKKLELDIFDALSLAYLKQENFKMAVYYYLPYIEEIKNSDNAAKNFDIMLNFFAMAYGSKDDSLQKVGKYYLFAAKRLADSVVLDNAQPALDYNLATYYFGEHNTDSGLYYSNRVIENLNADTQLDNQLQMAYGQVVKYFIDRKLYKDAKAAFNEIQRNTDTATYLREDKEQYWKYAYELDLHLGTPAEALYSLQQLKVIEDEVNKDKKNDQLLKYEATMKQLANENFVKAKEYEAKNQRYYVIFVTIIAILIFAGSTYLFFHWKKKRLLEKRYWMQLQVQKEVEHRNQLLEERTRISREMHDDLGTTLTSTMMAVEMVEMFPDQKEHLDRVRNSANELHQQVNEIIWNLNTQNDNVRSLNSYLIRFAHKFLEQADIRLQTKELVDDGDKAIPAFQRRMLSLSFKELINNVVKHAQATEVRVYIESKGDNYYLSVEDNGVGLEASPVLSEEVPYGSSGYGLGNVSRNISRLFGKVSWQRLAQGGTKVAIDINILAVKPPHIKYIEYPPYQNDTGK